MLLLAVIYLAFTSLGLPDTLLGSAWPVVHVVMEMPISAMGIVSMITSAGTVISSLMSDRLTRKFGTKYVTLFSVALSALSILGFSFSSRFWMLCVLAVPYGLAAGSIDSALNNYVALHYTSRHMSWLHAFWGVGAIISPYIMSYAIGHAEWHDGYRWVSYIQFGIAAVLLFSLPLWKIHENPDGRAAEKDSKPLGVIGALKINGVPTLLIGFFGYCSAEATAMIWASSYFAEYKGLPEETAAAYASLFYIGLTGGRFLAGLIADRLGDRRMIRLGTSVIAVGILLIILPSDTIWVTVAGFVTVGLGCAPVYPCIIHSTPANFGAENSQSIIGIQMASAYVGNTLMPPIFGIIAGAAGTWILPFYILILFGLMIIFTEITYNKTSNNQRSD